MPTKRELEQLVGQLQSKLKSVSNELIEFSEYCNSRVTYIPCGKIQKVYGHAWEEQICNAVCEQYDGTTGWIRIDMSRNDFPHEFLLVQVEYSDACGTMPGSFCPLAKHVAE